MGTAVHTSHEPRTRRTATHVIVMGVSGAGKSTVGALVAEALGLPFLDADSLHPAANIRKMASGKPLNDDDRWPWLEIVGNELANSSGSGLVIACSALKRSYRDVIRSKAPDTIFLHLVGSVDVLRSRLDGRSGHFMPSVLLTSQLAILESLEDDENAVVVDIAASITEVLAKAMAGINEASSH